jgi:hypothetical protein
MSGYVRIHRTLIGHPAFRNDAEAMAFAWLVAKAAWRSVRVRYKERPICLERGQLAISVREFAAAMDRDKAWIERLLKRLKTEGMVETLTETGVTVITICNYGQYQTEAVLCETPSETPAKTQRKTGARQGQDTEQEREKGKKEKIALPGWLPETEYLAFRKMRKAMRVPYTDDAERGIIADLERLRAEGHDLKKVLMKAVKRSWRGVFGDDDTLATGDQKRELTAQEWRDLAELLEAGPA